MLLFGLLVHTADLYSPTMPRDISLKWVDMINAEFSAQLREEKSLGIKQSTFFENLDVPLVRARGESFFVEAFILPLWNLSNKVLEGALNTEVERAEDNLKYWKSVVATETSKTSKTTK